MSTQSLSIPETDAQLVSAVAIHDPDLARKVQLRLRALRLRCVVGQAAAGDTSRDTSRLEGARHSVWHSLRWPWWRRGPGT